MQKVLIIYFSQSGQLARVVESIAKPLQACEKIKLVTQAIEVQHRYPFPWPFLQFFNTFPETVYADSKKILPLAIDDQEEFDLIILAYQVWFLSPSLPIVSFLQSERAKSLLKNKPVITVIACRNMWLMAQEKMKNHLISLQARLIDNVALVDNAHSAFTFISTPMWVLTGNQGPFLNGLIPQAGLSNEQIEQASRFGQRIAEQLPNRETNNFEPMLQGLGAVTINQNLIASEKIAQKSFRIWGAMLRFIGNPESKIRQSLLSFYILFLITLILTVVPISALAKKLLTPFRKNKTEQQRIYFAAPSGDSTDCMEHRP